MWNCGFVWSPRGVQNASGVQMESKRTTLGAFAFGTHSRYAETGTANVRRFFQFVLVASTGGQLPVGRMHILPQFFMWPGTKGHCCETGVARTRRRELR